MYSFLIMVKIVLVDDHEVVRKCIWSLLDKEEDFQVIGEAANGYELLELLQNEASLPDIVLTDMNMPGLSGLDIIKQLQLVFPQIRIIIFSSEDHEAYVSKAMRAGASGYLLKDICEDELILAVKQVYSGEKYICSELASLFADKQKYVA